MFFFLFYYPFIWSLCSFKVYGYNIYISIFNTILAGHYLPRILHMFRVFFNDQIDWIHGFCSLTEKNSYSNVKYYYLGSIKENPDKYSPLFYENMPTTMSHCISNYAHYPYFQEQYQTSDFDMKAMLVEEG